MRGPGDPDCFAYGWTKGDARAPDSNGPENRAGLRLGAAQGTTLDEARRRLEDSGYTYIAGTCAPGKSAVGIGRDSTGTWVSKFAQGAESIGEAEERVRRDLLAANASNNVLCFGAMGQVFARESDADGRPAPLPVAPRTRDEPTLRPGEPTLVETVQWLKEKIGAWEGDHQRIVVHDPHARSFDVVKKSYPVDTTLLEVRLSDIDIQSIGTTQTDGTIIVRFRASQRLRFILDDGTESRAFRTIWILQFSDATMAERIRRALLHAATLAGASTTKEPF